MWAAMRACSSATRWLSGVLSASASVRNASAAPSRARVTTSKATSRPAASRSRSVEQRRVGDPAGERFVEDLDGVGLAAELREDLGVRDDRGAVEMQRPLSPPARIASAPTKSPAKASASALWYWP